MCWHSGSSINIDLGDVFAQKTDVKITQTRWAKLNPKKIYSLSCHTKSWNQDVFFTCKIFIAPCRLVSLTIRGLQQGGNLPTELGKGRNGPMGCKPSSLGDKHHHIPLETQMPCKPHIVENPEFPAPLSREIMETTLNDTLQRRLKDKFVVLLLGDCVNYPSLEIYPRADNRRPLINDIHRITKNEKFKEFHIQVKDHDLVFAVH